MAAILGRKIKMTSFYTDNGQVLPCTVVEAGPCYVLQIKTRDKEGVDSYQLAFGTKKSRSANKPEIKHSLKAGLDNPPLYVTDIGKRKFEKEFHLGEEITVSSFREGEKVNVIGVSKGKGFAGVMKRHGFSGGSKTHGQSDRLRAPGSVGGSSNPSRTFKGLKMAGRMGAKKTTVKKLTVIKIFKDSNLVLLKGAVPGNSKNFLKIISA